MVIWNELKWSEIHIADPNLFVTRQSYWQGFNFLVRKVSLWSHIVFSEKGNLSLWLYIEKGVFSYLFLLHMYIGYGVVYTIVVKFRSFVVVKYITGIARGRWSTTSYVLWTLEVKLIKIKSWICLWEYIFLKSRRRLVTCLLYCDT